MGISLGPITASMTCFKLSMLWISKYGPSLFFPFRIVKVNIKLTTQSIKVDVPNGFARYP